MVWPCAFGPVIDQKIIAEAHGERLEEAGFLLSFLGLLPVIFVVSFGSALKILLYQFPP